MTTITEEKATNYIENLIEYVEKIEGKESLMSLTTDSGMISAMERYNIAYQKFVTKFLNSPKNAQEIIKMQIQSNVYCKTIKADTNKKVSELIKRG